MGTAKADKNHQLQYYDRIHERGFITLPLQFLFFPPNHEIPLTHYLR